MCGGYVTNPPYDNLAILGKSTHHRPKQGRYCLEKLPLKNTSAGNQNDIYAYTKLFHES